MAAATSIVYQNAEGVVVEWKFDDALLTVQSLSYSVPPSAPATALHISTGGHDRSQTFQPNTSGNILLASSPAVTSVLSRDGITSRFVFSGIDYIGGGYPL